MSQLNLANIMLEAEKLKGELKKSQEEIRTIKITGESGAGLVKVVMSGTRDVLSTHLDDSILEHPKNVIEELITSAVNNATSKVNACTKDKMPPFSGLFNFQPPA